MAEPRTCPRCGAPLPGRRGCRRCENRRRVERERLERDPDGVDLYGFASEVDRAYRRVVPEHVRRLYAWPRHAVWLERRRLDEIAPVRPPSEWSYMQVPSGRPPDGQDALTPEWWLPAELRGDDDGPKLRSLAQAGSYPITSRTQTARHPRPRPPTRRTPCRRPEEDDD